VNRVIYIYLIAVKERIDHADKKYKKSPSGGFRRKKDTVLVKCDNSK
jgi:hypothetical protein